MSLSDRIRPDCEAAPWVIKEVKEMESRIEFWIEKSTMQAIQISGMETEIQILKAENARYREAIEWYANRNNWKFYSYKNDCKDMIDFSDLGCKSYSEEPDFACSSGGRRAREALKGE